MRRRGRSKGFTLVEMAIVVVVVVAILSVIAIVAYRKYVKRSHMGEAMAVTSGIRAGQEAHRAERGVYADVSSSLGGLYPASAPGSFSTAWGAPCSVCTSADAWKLVNVHPSGPVMYGYSTVAGVGASMVASRVGGGSTGPKVSSSGGSSGGATPTNDLEDAIGAADPFFATAAKGDTDGDGQSTLVMSYSHSNEIMLISEGD